MPILTPLLFVITLLAALAPAIAQEGRKPRVASINLCADQLLLSLAEPAQILSLGPYARDESLSYHAETAKAYAQNSGSAESVLANKPDLVVVGAYDSAETRRLIAASGIPVFTLPPWAGFEAGSRDIRTFAAQIGQKKAGEALIAQIESARQDAARNAKLGTRALVLGRGGYLDISASLVHDLLAVIGFADAATRLDGTKTGGAGRFLPLEEVLTLRPDVLVLGESIASGRDGVRGVDRKAQFFSHPAFRKVYPEQGGNPRRITLPERLTACGGVSLVEALAVLRKVASE